jgi:hypothetical protein
MCQNGSLNRLRRESETRLEQIPLRLLDGRQEANFIPRPGRNKKTGNEKYAYLSSSAAAAAAAAAAVRPFFQESEVLCDKVGQ